MLRIAIVDDHQIVRAGFREMLADELTELARYWPWDDRLVLLWRHPEELIAADAAGWCRLADVLAEATERRFETLLLIRGYDG